MYQGRTGRNLELEVTRKWGGRTVVGDGDAKAGVACAWDIEHGRWQRQVALLTKAAAQLISS
jgi:hypothetical protein